MLQNYDLFIKENPFINPKNIHAYVLGEHGDSEFVSWNNSTIGVSDINEFLTIEEQNKIEDNVRNAAYNIINKKGNTSYGIGMMLTRITNAILGDENTILTVSSYNEEHDVFIGEPTIINKTGADKRIKLNLKNEEQDKFNNSIKILKDAINKIKD